MGKVNSRRIGSLMLIVCMLVTLVMPYQVTAAIEKVDNKQTDAVQGSAVVSNHWAQDVLNKWIRLGLLKGDKDQNYRPDDPVTRAEFTALINRVFNLPAALASDKPFADVGDHSWFASDVNRLHGAGMIMGAGGNRFEPNKPITRQDAAVIVARAFKVKAENKPSEQFADASSIAAYAIAEVSALSAKGYVKGKGNHQFKPKENTTRSEVIQMIDNVMGNLAKDKGEFKTSVDGNLVVNTDDISLKNMVISGDLFITQGAGEGELLLEGVTVKGSTYILGGGKNSIIIRDSVLSGTLIVDKWNSQIRIVAEGTTEIQEVQMFSGGILKERELKGKGFLKVVILIPNDQINRTVVLDGEFDEVQHMTGKVNFELSGSTQIIVMTFNAPANVTGDGVIQNATLNVSGVKLNKWPIKIIFSSNVTATIGNELVSADNRNTTTNSGGNGPEPTTSPEPTPGPSATIVQSGVANADIFVDSSANDMMELAAKELQDTIKMVSGAELPVYKWNSQASVSAALSVKELNVKKSGRYPISIQLINNEETPVHVNLSQSNAGPIKVNLPEQTDLAAYEKKTIQGSVEVTNELTSGEYEAVVQATAGESALSPMKLTVHYDPNLLGNAGFELTNSSSNVPSGWYMPSGERDNAVFHGGAHSMRIDLGSGNAYMFARSDQNFKLTPGKSYKLSAWVKATGAGEMNMEIHEMLANGTNNPVTTRVAKTLSTNWQRIELDYRPAESATYDYNRIFFFMSGTESMWVDDISLTETGLMYNSGFEIGNSAGTFPDGWFSPTGAWDDEAFKSGAKSLRLDLPGAEGYTLARSLQDFHLQQGKRYKLSAWVKGASAGSMDMEIHEMLAGGGNNPVNARKSVTLTDSWQYVELDYTPDVNAQYDRNWVYFFLSGTDKLWIDDVTLTEMEDFVPAGENGSSGSGDDRVRIILATPDTNAELSNLYPADLAYLHDTDGFAIRTSGKKIYIFGDNARGALNGVYDFLKENAGVLWTRSTDFGTLYDQQSTVTATKIDYAQKSPFKLRGWHTVGTGKAGEFHSDADTESMLARNKLNAKLAEVGNIDYWGRQNALGLNPVLLGHNLDFWLPNEKYFDTHPEYYNEINGVYVPVTQEFSQINFYNPDVPGVIANEMRQLLAVQPMEYLGVGIMDNQVFNQGELSKQPFTTPDGLVVQPTDPAYKSTVYFTFLNKIAANLKTTNPNVKIATFAYFFTDTPPKVNLEDNIIIVMAPGSEDERVPFNTSDQSNSNYAYKLKLESWVQKTHNILMYNYYGCCATDIYERPIAEKVQADVKYYRDLGIMGVVPEGQLDNGVIWGVNALQYWLINNLFWNPDADLEALKTMFLEKAYGAAADSMRTYYDLIEQGWNYDQQAVSVNSRASQLIGNYVIKAGIKDAAQAALDEAWQLADEQARKRIEPIKTTFETIVYLVGELPNLSATASKTSYSKEQIMNSLDFSTGPWAKVTPVTEFREMGTRNQVGEETKVYLLWDDVNLYVGYENIDHYMEGMIVSDDAPGKWWRSGADDSVETYVTGDKSATYYGFFSNPKKVKFEYKSFKDSTYNGIWDVNAEVGTDRWNTVQVIPFASIGVNPSNTDTLYGFFFRNFHGKERYITWGGGMVWNPADFYPIQLKPNSN
ncbi:DUF4838 domain-containing protein [Cohnella soli]|uniref:DUF4838 domain-containing protein n=1 Tax=Cohnella soli TaxID=425005 RepID=A0ABW0HV05_9BACL